MHVLVNRGWVAGGATRVVQNGRLQWYALVLVAAVGVFALALWIFT